MRGLKKTVSLLLAAALMLTPFGSAGLIQAAKKGKKAGVKVSSVKITNTGKKLRLQKGKKFSLKTSIKVKPNKSRYKKLSFFSSNRKTVAVNSRGILKGLKAGTAKITVKSKADPGKKASITVEVTKDVLVGSVTLNKKKITAEEFQEEKIPLHVTKILPSNAKNKKVVWLTSDKDVANVDHTGTVTVGGEGTAVITASAADKGGAYAECRVTVTEKEDQDDDEDDDAETQAPPVVPTQNPGALEPGVVTAEPATAEPGGVTAEPATEKPDDVTAEPATEKPDDATAEPATEEPDDATEKPTRKPTSPPATKRPRPTKKPTSPPATKKPAWTPNPGVAAKVENVSIKYDYEFPGTRMVRFDGTVVDHNNMDEPETYENAKAEGYPEGGIDVRYYEKVIVKYEGKKLTGDGDWYGKATLSSTGEWLGQNEYADGLFLKYLNDVECEGGYRNGIYTVEYNIDETRMVDGFDFYDAELIDCISVELAAEDEYAGFRLLSVDFIAPGKEPVSTACPVVPPIPRPTSPPFSGSLANPETDSTGTTTWDCVWFGDYWQGDTNGDGKADKNDAKQPVKWRVLSVDGDDAFLLADKNIDVQRYNKNYVDVTWETSTMRSWLNGYGAEVNQPGEDFSTNNFLDNAFTGAEQRAIRTTNVVNDDNPEYDTEGGNDTSDKVYLLSTGEVTNPAYGFSSDYSKEDKSRRAKNTAYAEAQGAWTATGGEYAGNGFWWLRSPGGDSKRASYVLDFGNVFEYGDPVSPDHIAVRPALHLNLSSSSGWSYAGTVTSEGGDRPPATKKPAWTPDPGVAAKVENVSIKYDYEFPGTRMVRFDGTVVDHNNMDEPETYENAKAEGYPEGGIDVRYYEKVIVKYEGKKLTGDGDWFGKATLSSTDEGLGQNEYADGLFLKYLNDVECEGGYRNGIYTVEYNIDEMRMVDGFDFEDVGLVDCISVELAAEDEYAGFRLLSVDFIAPGKEPVPVPTNRPTARPGVETAVPVPPIPRPTSPPFSGSLVNPETDSTGTTTWDCVWFGDYWQEDTNGDGKADKNDAKQPVKWRVLSVDGDDAFLVADQNLDCQTYNGNYADVTWETCSMRSWLNGYGTEANEPGKDYSGDNFLANAFSESERSAIRTTRVVNGDNPDPEYGTEGGNDTSDKVYLLSIGEVTNPAYGFSSDFSKEDKSRRANNTAYAEAQGAWTYTDGEYAGNGFWWLRSPGYYGEYAFIVYGNGFVYADGGIVVDGSDVGVRPALHLNLSSSSGWSYAGTVTSEGGDRPGVDTGAVDTGVVETAVPVPPIPRPTSPPFSGSLANPETDSTGTTTWDCVWFGDYWQEDTNGDGKADKNDAKQPVKWRVLSVDGDDAFLVADQNLDCQTYNGNYADVTWETCSMRSWLNGYGTEANEPGKDYSGDNFLANAFSESERSAIRTTRVVNGDNPDPEYGTEGGNDTSDKVYLLSIGEATNPAYGFSSDYSKEDEGRRAKNTAYAEAQGAWIPTEEYDGNGFWWLRSPGRDGVIASRVDYFGYVDADGSPVDNWCVAVRPALHLNLSSSSGWSYAGTVTSEGGDRPGVETAVPVPVPSYHPTAHPGVETGVPVPVPSYHPTARPGVETGVPVPVPSYHPTARPGVETAVPVPVSPIPRPTSPPFSGSLANPETDSAGTTTWDCVWFGNYWQEDTNGDGKADKNDAKQPVKWRVLSVDGDDAFLVADQSLDCQTYNDNLVDVTWETCSMRSWLNGYGAEANEPGKDYSGDNFLNNAFTGAEQRAIRTTNVVNDDNPEYGTEGGNDTSDKVYLLSIGEATNPAYGFSSNYSMLDKSRRAKNTAYAEAQGAWTATDQEHDDEYAGGFWWLRSPGIDSRNASNVSTSGSVNALGDTVDDYSDAVRPALHLNLSSSSGWSYAGTVTSEGGDRPGVETD